MVRAEGEKKGRSEESRCLFILFRVLIIIYSPLYYRYLPATISITFSIPLDLIFLFSRQAPWPLPCGRATRAPAGEFGGLTFCI